MAHEHDELVALIQPAMTDAADALDLARRCTAVLRRHGIGKAPDDWLVVERAGDRHCWRVLDDISTAEGLTTLQVARLRLALCGQSFTPIYGQSKIATEQPHLKFPLWRTFCKYTMLNPLEIMFVFTNRPGWYRAVFDALDGDRLVQALEGSSEIFLIVGALNMGGLLTLIQYDLSRPQAHASPLHVICLSFNCLAFMFNFCAVLVQLYTLHIYLPVHRNNLRDVVRSTRMLPMTGGLYFALGAWGIFLGLVCEAMRPMEGLDAWLFREQDLDWWWRAVPVLTIVSCVAIFISVPFFVQISATARCIAHSGALAERQVLPPEASSWSTETTKRALTAVALSNPDLEALYFHRQRGSSGADGPQNASSRRKKLLFGMRKRLLRIPNI